MNKASWTDCFFFIINLFKIKTKKKVLPACDVSKTKNDSKEEDKYYKQKGKNSYGKKRRRKNYTDYC